jgi:two-component system response regulator AtoC
MKEKLLIIDDDRVFCELLKRHFAEEYVVTAFTDPEDAVKYIRGNTVDVILTDLSMPKIDGLEVLKIAKSETFNTDVIIMTAYARVDTAVEAMRKGAYDYIIKPFALDEISLQLKNLFEKRGLLKENTDLRKFVETTYRPQNMIGESEEMKEVYRFVEQVAPTDATVLISGESGTGKELIARAIHFSGNRKDRRLVSINCTAIPETLLESELFGYTKGAFTGAGKDSEGLFVHAEGGTIFLDEIVDASLPIQAKLLRTLQEHTVRPLGGNKEVPVDVRVICATNRDIREMMKENKFRADLYHRINVISVHLPPLRERKGDIPLLIKHFLMGMKKIHPRAVEMLSRYNWPGNVRELKNLVERLVVFSEADTIMPGDISSEIGMPHSSEDDELPYNEAKRKITDEFNRAVINKALLKHNGNVTRAADALKLDRANFQRLMRRYGITSKEFKEVGGKE